jgi:hypothetical protein
MSGTVWPWTVVVVVTSPFFVTVSPLLRSPLWMVRFGLFGPTYPDRLSARVRISEDRLHGVLHQWGVLESSGVNDVVAVII